MAKIKEYKIAAAEQTQKTMTESLEKLTDTVDILCSALFRQSEGLNNEIDNLWTAFDTIMNGVTTAVHTSNKVGFDEMVDRFAILNKNIKTAIISQLIPEYTKLAEKLFNTS